MNAKLVGFKTYDFKNDRGEQVVFTKCHFLTTEVEPGFNGASVFTINFQTAKCPQLVLNQDYALNYALSSSGKTYLASCVPIK